jgi:phosphoglycolate phosphatase-like HAD superfamily hydrolase
MKKAIVFDLDGTLITCENKQKYVLFSILKSIYPVNCDCLIEWWNLKRNGFNTELALNHLGIPQAKLISDEWKKNIEDFPWISLDAPYKDSVSTLSFLNSTGLFRTYLLTARKSKAQVFQIIKKFGFEEYFYDVLVVNPQNVVEAKINFLKKIDPTLYIGDTELDYMASLKSGTGFVALSRGQRSTDFLKKAGEFKIEQDLNFIQEICEISSF